MADILESNVLFLKSDSSFLKLQNLERHVVKSRTLSDIQYYSNEKKIQTSILHLINFHFTNV